MTGIEIQKDTVTPGKQEPFISCPCGFVVRGMSEERMVEAHYDHECSLVYSDDDNGDDDKWYDAAFTVEGAVVVIAIFIGLAILVSAFKGDLVW